MNTQNHMITSCKQNYASHIADKQTFSKLDVVGWYTSGEDLSPDDMEVNKTVGGRAGRQVERWRGGRCAWERWGGASDTIRGGEQDGRWAGRQAEWWRCVCDQQGVTRGLAGEAGGRGASY
jgi:hypothetical protein